MGVGVGGVGVGDVEQKILFTTGCNRTFCVPDFIQGWETQSEFKISSFSF